MQPTTTATAELSALELDDVDTLIAELEVKLEDIHELSNTTAITRDACGTTENTVRNTCHTGVICGE